jgi:hypothetical protein
MSRDVERLRSGDVGNADAVDQHPLQARPVGVSQITLVGSGWCGLAAHISAVLDDHVWRIAKRDSESGDCLDLVVDGRVGPV